MTSENFAYWLQGFFEISKAETLTKEQVTMIKNHLNLVFVHELDPKETKEVITSLESTVQDYLQKTHDGQSSLSGPPKNPIMGSPNGGILYRC